jgi:hypothetical protein
MPVFVRFQGWAARRGWQFYRVLIVHNSTHGGVYIAHAYAGFVGGVDDLDFAAQVKLRHAFWLASESHLRLAANCVIVDPLVVCALLVVCRAFVGRPPPISRIGGVQGTLVGIEWCPDIPFEWEVVCGPEEDHPRDWMK